MPSWWSLSTTEASSTRSTRPPLAGIPVVSVTDIPKARLAATIPGNDRGNGAAAAELLRRPLNGRGEILVFGAYGHASRIDERLAGSRGPALVVDDEEISARWLLAI